MWSQITITKNRPIQKFNSIAMAPSNPIERRVPQTYHINGDISSSQAKVGMRL